MLGQGQPLLPRPQPPLKRERAPSPIDDTGLICINKRAPTPPALIIEATSPSMAYMMKMDLGQPS
jgi:hypothetical protein